MTYYSTRSPRRISDAIRQPSPQRTFKRPLEVLPQLTRSQERDRTSQDQPNASIEEPAVRARIKEALKRRGKGFNKRNFTNAMFIESLDSPKDKPRYNALNSTRELTAWSQPRRGYGSKWAWWIPL